MKSDDWIKASIYAFEKSYQGYKDPTETILHGKMKITLSHPRNKMPDDCQLFFKIIVGALWG